MLNFRCIDQAAGIYGAEGQYVGAHGRSYVVPIRIDGRSSKFRVDAMKPLFPAWEAIDGGRGLDTLDEAKAYADLWLAAANDQCDLSPRGLRENLCVE